jgi:hypothetical protein
MSAMHSDVATSFGTKADVFTELEAAGGEE